MCPFNCSLNNTVFGPKIPQKAMANTMQALAEINYITHENWWGIR